MRVQILILAFLILGSTVPSNAQNTDERRESGRLVKILAGDSIEMRSGDQTMVVTLIGVVAPTQQYAKESQKALSNLLKDKQLEFIRSPDNNNSGANIIKAKLFYKGMDVALSQLTRGYVLTESKPPHADANAYREAIEKAKKDRSGIWGIPFKECVDSNAQMPVAKTITADSPPHSSTFPVYGKVRLEVIIDQNGNVTSSKALCGHPALQTIAAKASLAAKFDGGREYLIQGTMTYNFLPKK